MIETRICRRKHLPALTGLSLATIYRLLKAGDFPAPIKLSIQAVGWDIAAIDRWVESRRKASQH